jgi:hypothetical protein
LEYLSNIFTEINRYFAPFIFLFGFIGNILNILVLSQQTLRSNSCGWLFLQSSIANLISICFGLTKCRAYIVYSSRTIACWLLMLATIYRWFSSCINPHYRQISSLKIAKKVSMIVIFVSLLLYLHMFLILILYFNINDYIRFNDYNKCTTNSITFKTNYYFSIELKS